VKTVDTYEVTITYWPLTPEGFPDRSQPPIGRRTAWVPTRELLRGEDHVSVDSAYMALRDRDLLKPMNGVTQGWVTIGPRTVTNHQGVPQ